MEYVIKPDDDEDLYSDEYKQFMLKLVDIYGKCLENDTDTVAYLINGDKYKLKITINFEMEEA